MAAVGTESIRIARSIAIVREQFFDVAHHCENQVHSGARWRLLSRSDDGRRTVAIGRQVADIFWEDDVLWLAIVRGPGAGTTIAHRFEAVFAGTEVVATFRVPLPGPLMILAPLVRWIVARELRKGLAEDEVDLRTYKR